MAIIDLFPGIRSLRTFDAVVRHLSFSKAAEELGVSTPAVSHHITELEARIGVPLCVRDSRSVKLTPDGERLWRGVAASLEYLADALRTIKQPQSAMRLRISVTPSLAIKWLVPRLSRFLADKTEIDVRIGVSNKPPNFLDEDFEVVICEGGVENPNFRSDLLFNDRVFPVCSPKIITREKPLDTPGDLRRHQLIYLDWTEINPPAPALPFPDWRTWMEAAGVSDLYQPQGLHFRQASLAIEAALSGQGVTLGESVLVADDLAAGRLVRPFEISVGVPPHLEYHIISPCKIAETPLVGAFRAWILEEIALTLGHP